MTTPIDGRSPSWPDDWHPTTAAEVAEALIAELRNALVPVRYRMRRDGSEELKQVERVLEMADVCAERLARLTSSEPMLGFGPLPDYGTHMTWERFLSNVQDDGWADYDGHAVLATATQASEVTINPSEVEGFVRPDWATHVVWFNR